MSQVSIIDIEGNHPQIPTSFVTDDGIAIPLANILEILATTVAAGTNPIRTVGAANVVTIEAQISQAIAATNLANVGLSAFNSADFTVDANGFVSLVGGGGGTVTSFGVDASTAPGTDPVLPDGAGLVTITGAQVETGTVGVNVIRSNSIAANQITLEIQRTTTAAGANSALNGVAHFDSATFDVDTNGFVQLNGATVGQTITGTTGGALSPTAGNWNILGGTVVAGTTPIATAGAVSTLTINIQRAQAIAAPDSTKIGLANFDSAVFTVDADGFVTLAGGGLAIDSIGVDATSGGGTNPVLPTALGLVTVNGALVAAGTNPVRSVSTAANIYQIQVQTSQALAAEDSTQVGLSNFSSTDFAVAASGFVTLSTTGAGKTITGDAGGALSPTANNWNIIGQLASATNVMTTTGAVSTLSIEDRTWPTRFVVDASSTVGLRGTYTTITAAIAAASAGDTVFVRAGTYTEDIALKTGVNICGLPTDGTRGLFVQSQFTPTVKIIGKMTYSSAGSVDISNVFLQTNGDFLLEVTGTAASFVAIQNSYIYCSNNTGISSTSTSSGINLTECQGDLGTTGIAYFALSGGGNLAIIGGNYGNSGSSTTASTWTAGILTIQDCGFASFITSSGAGSLGGQIFNVNFNIGALNTTIFTHDNTTGSGSIMRYCNLGSGTASAVSVGSGAVLEMYDNIIKSSNTNAVTGAGTIIYGETTFSGTSSVMNTTTQTAVYTNIGKYKASGQPAFSAYLPSAEADETGDGTLFILGDTDVSVSLTEIFDQDSNFNPGTAAGATFTAPDTGKYQFNACVLLQQVAATNTATLRITTSNRFYTFGNWGTAVTGNMPLALAILADMDAADTCFVTVDAGNGAKTVDVFGGVDLRTFFTGYLVA